MPSRRFNPGGSVKDRPALNIIQTALANGDLQPGKRLLDSTSGNMGISYATFGAALGIPVTLAIPSNASRGSRPSCTPWGVEVIQTDAGEGIDGAIVEAGLAASSYCSYWYAHHITIPRIGMRTTKLRVLKFSIKPVEPYLLRHGIGDLRVP